MSLFAKIQKANLQTTERDVLGGGSTVPSAVYDSGIKIAYVDAAKSGAISVTFEFAILANGSERSHKETFYISNREGSFTYKDKNDGSDKPLPGYATVDAICKAACGKSLSELEAETKTVKLYDYTAKAEIPQAKEVLMDLLGAKIKLGLVEETIDKTSLNENTGKYEPTGETRDQNVVNKVFNKDGLTSVELEAGKTEPVFMESWAKKFDGVKVNKAKGAKAGTGAVAGKPSGGATGQNMFG